MKENMKLYRERKDKVWAMAPKPEYGSFEAVQEHLVDVQREVTGQRVRHNEYKKITDANLKDYLQLCVAGLAHVPDLAERRLQHAMETPRTSNERVYERSFIEPQYYLGSLAVVAYTPKSPAQPNEWLVEAFLGGVIEPERRTRPLIHKPIFGVDAMDTANLEYMIGSWYPPEGGALEDDNYWAL